MAELKLYSNQGVEIGTLPVPNELFNIKPKAAVIHEVMVGQSANSRDNIAHSKDRSEVRGGGKKPWKQKGTGRARHGSSRSPIWVGGGVTHGPRNTTNFSVKVNKKLKRTALAMVLTDKLNHGTASAVENFDFPEAKTKFASVLKQALVGTGSVLFVATTEDKTLKQSAKNLVRTAVINAHSLNVTDLLKASHLVFSKRALEVMAETFVL